MSDRAENLASQFETANSELIDAIGKMSSEQWTKTAAAEGWTAGVVSHHIASSYAPLTGLVQAVAGGASPGLSLAVVNNGNATHARDAAACTVAETIAIARRDGAAATGMIRRLSDGQLDTKGVAVTEMGEMSAQQLIEGVFIGHVSGHLASIRTV